MHIILLSKIQILRKQKKWQKELLKKRKETQLFLIHMDGFCIKGVNLQDAAKVMESVINSGEKPDAVWYEHYGYILEEAEKMQ